MSRMATLALLICVPVVSAGALTYEVAIENMIPGGPEMGQPMTPPVVVVHGAGYTLFDAGELATAGLELLAEDGMTADLVAEAEANADVQQVVVGGGPFFGTEIVQVTGNPGELLSLVTMLARSNDLITGIHDVALPASGSVEILPTGVYDAGTEQNTGMVEHIPFYGNSLVGPEEDAVISMISEYAVLNDPDYKEIRYTFPPSARVRITVIEPTPAEEVTWGSVKALFR